MIFGLGTMKHILIDFENTRPEPAQLNALSPEGCHIWLFLGALQQKSLSVDLCEALCRFGQQVHFVRISRLGKNALDFYLAYYLGKITEQDSEALICILSRDTGFDVLVEHLENNELCRGIVRLGEVSDAAQLNRDSKSEFEALPACSTLATESDVLAKTPTNHTVQTVLRLAMTYLRQEGVFHPKSRDNLEKRLYKLALDQEVMADMAHVKTVVDKLLTKEFITVNNEGLLNYHFSHKDLVTRIVQHVAKGKPKSLDALRNVLRPQATAFSLQHGDSDLDIFVDYCQKEGVLRIQGNKVEYPPFAHHQDVTGDTKQELARLTQLFFNKFKNNKPKKHDSLIMSLKAALKINDTQIKNLINYLKQKRYLAISDTGKVVYFK